MQVIMCILHCLMAIGRLLAQFIQDRAQVLGRETTAHVQDLLTEGKTGLRLGGTLTPDGEETTRLFGIWPQVGVALGLCPGDEAYDAVTNMYGLLRALYRTYQPNSTPDPTLVTRKFREHIAPESASHYLLFLEHDVQFILPSIHPYGLALFSGDLIESLNRLLKRAYNDHSNRGGGGGTRGGR